MFQTRNAIEPVNKKQMKLKQHHISNYGGRKSLKTFFFLFSAKFYKVWTMRFGMFEHTSDEISVSLK